MFETFKEFNGQIVNNQWIEWNHFGVPNKPKEYRDLVRSIYLLLGHCMKCTALDGCYFVERNMPKFPLHEGCDCNKAYISSSKVKSKANAYCPLEKFTKYVFADKDKSNGKKTLFEALGFGVEDSLNLKLEYEKQSLNNYLIGNYLLKDLDSNGQRLAIPITLSGKTFYSGWILEPEGIIRNTTPFGGWIK